MGLALGGCSPHKSTENKPAASDSAKTHKKRVLATFTVLADMGKNVAGKYLDVESITKPDAEIHDYQPTPNDIKKTEGAALVIRNGFGLERWFDRFIDAAGNPPSVVASDGVKPIDITEGDYKGKPNPHAWMSPKAGEIYVDNIAKAFAKLDPDHAKEYKANAEAYKKKIAAVGQTMEKELSSLPQGQRALVTCEGAFSYLTRDSNLQEHYLWGVNAEGALTPQRVADLEKVVKEQKIPVVFCESTVGDKMKPVAEATGAKFGGELYVDSLTGPDGVAPTYLDLLKYDADKITKGLTQK